MYIGVDSNGDVYCFNRSYEPYKLYNKKIVNIGYNGEIILENGKAYVLESENQLICVNDEFEELKNEKIANIVFIEDNIIILLENGKAYYINSYVQLICINDEFEKLKNEKIVNVSNNLILLEDGSIYNIDSNELINYNPPVLILKGKNIEKISAGNWHTVALDENGKVYTWGYNGGGQLGDGTTTSSDIPICISDISTSPLNKVKIKEISAGGEHTVAIDEEGKVYAWGSNGYGQLGDGTNDYSNIPICISDIWTNLINIQKISAGGEHTVALDKDGKVYVWGSNWTGQLGDGTTKEYSDIPICISDVSTNLVNIKEISAGGSHTVALDENGKVYAWGSNGYGQLGNVTTTSSRPICISDILTNLVNIKEISAGGSHTVALDENGKVYVWGNNYFGQLGDGTTTSSDIPICISDISGNDLYNQKALKISANGSWNVMIDSNGEIYIWGDREIDM